MKQKSIVTSLRTYCFPFFSLWLLFLTAVAQAQVNPLPLSIECPKDQLVWTCDNEVIVQYPPPSVTGGCPPYSIVCSPPSGSAFPVGVTTVLCRVLDSCQKQAECSFDIVVRVDTVPPEIQCPDDLIVHTCQTPTGGCAEIVNYPAPAASDNSGSVAVTCVPASGSVFPCGDTIVNCLAEDRCGNKTPCRFVVRVLPDGHPPTIECPPDITITTCSNSAVVAYPPPVVNPPWSTVKCVPAPGTILPLGSYTAQCVASNACGRAECSFKIEIRPDPQVSIQCPNDLTLTTCSNCAPLHFPTPTVLNGTLLGCDPAPGTCLPLGTHEVVCVASNECGLERCVFTVVVRPVPPVAIQCPTEPIVVPLPCGQDCVPVLYPLPSVVNGTLIGCSPAPGTCLPLGVHTVTCRASNECATVQCEFPVRVVPGQAHPPGIVCPQNISLCTCDPNGRIVNYPAPTVIPGSDPAPMVSCSPPSGSLFPLGNTVVECRVQDHCGNEAKCEFVVTINRDVRPPELHCPSNIVHCAHNSEAGAVIHYAPTVSDNCDPAPLVECVPPSGSFFPLGTTVVTCHAKDICGNESKCSFLVTVLTDRDPVLRIKKDGDFVVICWPKTCRCFKLQSTKSLNPPILWVDVPVAPDDSGDSWCVRLPLDSRHRFFRLVSCDYHSAPVYGVVSAGINPDQAGRLLQSLKIPRDQFNLMDGGGLFVDPQNFQAVPMKPIQDPGIIDELRRGTEDDGDQLVFKALDFDSLAKIRPMPGDSAIETFTRGLAEAGIEPVWGDPHVQHTTLEALDLQGRPFVDKVMLDTHVYFDFELGGIPLLGPGATLRMAFGPSGDPTALQIALRKLELKGEVQLIPIEEASRRCAALYPQLKADTRPALIYFAPPLALGSVQTIVPCFQCAGVAPGDGQLVNLLQTIIPATDDPQFVPSVELEASAQGTLVNAQATAKGGVPPYSYEWLSSSVDLGEFPAGAASIEYDAQPRAGAHTETVRVLVTDANGMQAQASRVVEIVNPGPLFVFLPAVGGVRDYGTERAVSDMGAAQQSGFNSRMSADGVTRRFNWTGLSAWERDFKEGGTGLDYNYVDNVDMTFYIGHGYGGAFTFESSQDDGELYYSNAVHAWGDIDLEWLALLSCQVLQNSYGGVPWYNRWIPDFDGLHIMLGFETNAHDWPAFGGTFADWMMGRFGFFPPMPVRTSWFLAKAQEQPAADIAVAIGVIGPGGITNMDDFFHGKGGVGPDIRGANVLGCWRLNFQ